MNLVRIFSFLPFVVLFSCSTSDDDESVLLDDDLVTNLDCSNSSNVFTIHLDPTACIIDIEAQLNSNSLYSESISGTTRTISINGIANHLVGEFPNSGNPNTISISTEYYTMTTTPELANTTTNGAGYTTGVLFSGVAIEPYTAEFFVGSDGTINRDWNITTLQSITNLGLDCNNAHVQPTGRYHYHGTPSNYINQLTADGSQMVKVGFAADGFPIYYKYVLNDDGSSIIALESGYELKSESRDGDGISAPNGCPDGYYFQDYEYVPGVSSLDECNGRFGKTPESDDEYYYVITDNFPSMPLCLSGTPDSSFSFRP